MPSKEAIKWIVTYCRVSEGQAWAILADWGKNQGVVRCMADLGPLFDEWDQGH